MKQLLKYIAIGAIILNFAAACTQSNPAPQGSLTITSGIDDNELIVDGMEGNSVEFRITAKMAWELLPTEGVTFSPTSGDAATDIKITATSQQSNNSLDRVRLGDVVFRLGTTRFVGITAYQAPQIIFKEAERNISIAANKGAQTVCDFSCPTSDFDIETNGEISATVSVTDSFKGLYRLIVTAQADNASNDTAAIGSVSFKVRGVAQKGQLEVIQQSAISFNRSRILMNGDVGSEYTIAPLSPFACTVSTTSSSFSAQCNADNTITLKTTAENSSDEERKVGKVIVSLRDYPSCSTEIDVWQHAAQCKETLLFYYLGTSLRSYFLTNLDMVERALKGQPSSKRIVTLLQTSANRAELYELYYDRFDEVTYRNFIKEIALPATYTSSMLAEVWGEMMNVAPAKEYSLIVGSHGLAWIPKESTSPSTPLSASQFVEYWRPLPQSEPVRFIGEGNARTQINTTEIAEAASILEMAFRYIIFDACYMSNIESAYDMRNAAKYILASPCEILARGLPYNTIVPIMLGDDDTQQMLDRVAKRFVDETMAAESGRISACTAVVKCDELEVLAASFKQVYKSISANFDTTNLQAYDGINAWSHPKHNFFDLMDFAKQGCTDTNAVAAFEKSFDKCVSSLYHTPSFYSAYNNDMNDILRYWGITTSLPILCDPSGLQDTAQKLQQTAWYKAITE